MRLIILSACLVLVLGMSGCAYTIHPILEKADFSKDNDVAGIWEPVTDDQQTLKQMTFSATPIDGGAGYDIELQGRKVRAEVGKIGTSRWCQIRQPDSENRTQTFLFSTSVYQIAKFEIEGDTLRLFRFDASKLSDKLRDLKISHVLSHPKDSIEFHVLTDETSKLKKLLLEHGDELLYKDPIVFRRKTR